MASIDWSAYVVLCDQMWDQHDAWYDAANLVELTERVTRSCSETAGAYTALSTALADGRTEDEVALMLRFAALSRPAADYDMGADYAGWFVSEYPTGTQVCATERFAELSVWVPVNEPESTDTTEPALTYDEETGLYYDAENWYLPDQTTVVTPDPGSPDRFRDASGTVYVHGEPWTEPALTYDEQTGLYYDAENWYLPDQTTIVTPDPDSPDRFRDANGTVYVHGQPWTDTPAATSDEAKLGTIVAMSLDEAMKLVPGAENLPPERLRALVAEVLSSIPS
jgi:hypothetical protein